jgi:hypothetical protein
MLATTTNIGEMGAVAGSLISDILPVVYIIVGIAVGFWILEILIGAVRKKE